MPRRLLGARVKDFPELFPPSPCPALKLKLGPDHVVAGGGVDLDAGQRGRQYKVFQVLCLLGVPTMTPTEFSRPAGLSVPATDDDGKFMMIVAFQPVSAARRIACAANFGVPAMNSAWAPELFNPTTWESIVGSVTS